MIEVYTKSECNYCKLVKEMMRERGMSFTEYKLNEDFTRETLLERYPSATTYPVVVDDGFYIGGYSELRQKLNEDQQNTKKMLLEG